MFEFVYTLRRLRQLLLLGCLLFTFALPWWNTNVQANDNQSIGQIRPLHAPAAQLSPLSPLQSALDSATSQPTALPTVAPTLPAPTPTLPAVMPSPVAPALTSGPLYSGVAASPISPMLIGALIVALLGVGAIVFTRQR